MRSRKLLVSLTAFIMVAALDASGVAPSQAAESEVESCSFSANGGTSEQHLTVSIASGGSAVITPTASPSTSAVVKHRYGFVPKPNSMDQFTFSWYGGGATDSFDFYGSAPFDLGRSNWTIADSAELATWQGYDVSYLFLNFEYSPQDYYYVLRYFSGSSPYTLLCSVIVDYAPKSPGVNYGHSDKTSDTRNRQTFSEDPSGAKPKKR